ncbi:MAG TPA: methyl-galactoside ABC transporter substrate-binding protein, partial [Clostridia bacterium]|nr:methyl-galactoside ABC transporter substrate-binding protein [Clostridia bacterium]
MKKFLVLLLALVMVLSVVGCGATETDEPAAEENEETMEEASDEMPSIGVTIYKYDDNFMSFVRRAITSAAEGKAE